jgi:hypothetical protein
MTPAYYSNVMKGGNAGQPPSIGPGSRWRRGTIGFDAPI